MFSLCKCKSCKSSLFLHIFSRLPIYLQDRFSSVALSFISSASITKWLILSHRTYKLSNILDIFSIIIILKFSLCWRIASVYGAVVFVQVALMVASYFEDFQKTCSDLTGIWIRIVGSMIGFTFVSIGFLYYKKFTISKKNFISLFTIE